MPDNFEEIIDKKYLEKNSEKNTDSKVEKKELKNIDLEKESKDTKEKKITVDPLASGSIVTQANAKNKNKEKEKKIEKILEDNLEETFIKMSNERQAEFKKEGEKTVNRINILLSQTKVNIKKIIILIKNWLSIIPGINKFFLEQESKIKADNIIKLKD